MFYFQNYDYYAVAPEKVRTLVYSKTYRLT